MSADWDEVKRLAADFQRAQLSSTVLKLSERNCIEIVKKLIESKLIEVIFTNDGKEYLTPARLLKEIKDELLVHGGRINLVDLAQLIGVDFSHVETKANEFLNLEPNVCMVLGQLITSDYLDHLAEEINEKLHQVGEISIADIAVTYDLPGDFLEQVLHERLGTILQGQVDSNDSRTFFTDSYVAQHTARIRGALSALTRPVPLASIINHFKFPEKLFYHVAEELVKEGRLAGSLSGGKSERAIFVPDIYARSQNDWISSFYKQNGYLEYDAVARLGVLDPKSHLKKKFKEEGLTFLSSCCVGKNIINQIEVTIEEALNNGTWVDVFPVLPSIFSSEDCQAVITEVTRSIAKQGSIIHVYCDTIVVSEECVKSFRDSFEPLMEAKAKEDISKSPHLFTAQQPAKDASLKKEAPSKGKQDKKEDRKKKGGSGGKLGSGSGTHGREIKTKSLKKKHVGGKGAEDFEAEEDLSREGTVYLDFLSVKEIEAHLAKLDNFKDAPEDLIAELASEMHRPLTKRYREVANALFESTSAASSGSRRKQHAECQEKFSSLIDHITLFERSTKLFSDEIAAQLCKHLQKTLCTDLTNNIISYLAQEHGLTAASDIDASLSVENRLKVINKFSEEVRQPLLKLHNSLNEKTLEEFHSSVDTALGAGICDMIIRKLDKRKERSLLANHRQSLLAQLSDAQDPALCLHLASLLLFQTQTRSILHASGKFVPHIVGYLQKHLPIDLHHMLSTYQESVIKKLTASENEEEKQVIESNLLEMMPKIKEAAVTYKKASISESEN